jgi:hypothetical protein
MDRTWTRLGSWERTHSSSFMIIPSLCAQLSLVSNVKVWRHQKLKISGNNICERHHETCSTMGAEMWIAMFCLPWTLSLSCLSSGVTMRMGPIPAHPVNAMLAWPVNTTVGRFFPSFSLFLFLFFGSTVFFYSFFFFLKNSKLFFKILSIFEILIFLKKIEHFFTFFTFEIFQIWTIFKLNIFHIWTFLKCEQFSYLNIFQFWTFLNFNIFTYEQFLNLYIFKSEQLFTFSNLISQRKIKTKN